ncbi:MAG: hypothetical protein IKM59_02580, partial [Oscillospiraceae bacterium]|nr:hypothetical protein [Oscillospiraceae bacterium]
LDLYQIPVYSKHDLNHGTYYVSVMVNDKVDSIYDFLSRGNQFFLDAIRIYDPIDVTQGKAAPTGSDSAVAYVAYCADVEAHVIVKEVREILLSAETYNGMTGMTDGAVYVDYATVPTVTTPTTSEGTGGEDITDPELVGKVENHITSDILTYKKIGPNNETYLGPQQLVAFQLLVFSKTLPNRLDIGAKAITEDPTMLSVKILDTTDGQDLAYTTTVQGPAQQYFNLYLEADAFESTTVDGKSCYITTVIISNPRVKNTINVDKILSITDIRVGYRNTTVVYDPPIGTPTKRNADVELPEDEFVPVRFVVTSELGDIVNEALEEMYKPCTHTPGQWETIAQSGVGCSGIEQIRCTRCGEILETRITEEIPTPVFAGASVALQSDLTIYYKVKESAFAETGFTDPYVVICDNGTETVIRDYSVQDGSYSFAYRNIAPHRMGDTLTATLYATYNGQVYACQSKDYSVADYCYNMLSKTEGDDSYAKLRTLLVDILLYGAESQKYTNYKADALCTARLTEDQLACGTAELTRELVNCRDQAYEVIDNPTVEWKGAGLNLRESVAVRFKISAESYEGLEVKITLEGRTETFKSGDFDYRTDGAYVHFTGLNAAQLSEPIYVAAFRDGVQVSNTICYSVESYAYSKQNDTTIAYLASLVERMMCYGDSARAYVGK